MFVYQYECENCHKAGVVRRCEIDPPIVFRLQITDPPPESQERRIRSPQCASCLAPLKIDARRSCPICSAFPATVVGSEGCWD